MEKRKIKRRNKGKNLIHQPSSKKSNENKEEFRQRIPKQLQNFVNQNPEVKSKNNLENKNDRPSY